MSEYTDDAPFKTIKSLVICSMNGFCLVDYTIDPKLDPILLSAFVSALSMFGEEVVGKIKEINIKGIDIDILFTQKKDLMLVVMLEKGFAPQDIKKISIDLLEAFLLAYEGELDRPNNLESFKYFKEVIDNKISVLLADTNKSKSNHTGQSLVSIKERVTRDPNTRLRSIF